MTYQNVCIRCGKLRVVGSIVEEKVNNSTIFSKEMVCPDPECQKKVLAMLERDDKRRVDALLLKANNAKARGITLGPKAKTLH